MTADTPSKSATEPREAAVMSAFRRADDALRRTRRRQTALFFAILVIAILAAAEIGEVSVIEFIEGLPGFTNYLYSIAPPLSMATLGADLAEWYWGLWRWLGLLFDTIVIAALATLLGSIGGVFLCFLASRNLVKNTAIYFAARRVAEVARAVPVLVYALIFVFAFGLGPLPGVLAIAIHTAGALAKLFAEVNENIDMRTVEGVRASGGNWPQMIRFGVVPQVLPNYLSYGLLRFEINIREASIIGFVGAGGIGQELMFVIRQFIFVDISAIILMIMITVMMIDMSCERLRHSIIGKENLV